MKVLSDTDKENGYTILSVLIIIISLSILCMSIALLVYSDRRLIKALADKKERYEEAQKLCERILQSFNTYLVIESSDGKNSTALQQILREFEQYYAEIEKLSDKINTAVLKDEILSDKSISSYINTHPENTGSYSYLNINLTDEKTIESIIKDHNAKDTYNLFPLLNYLPLFNVNNMDEDFIRVILTYCKVPESTEKAQKIYSMVQREGFTTYEELKEIMGVRDTSPVWDFLGVKTQMYKVTARCKGIGIELVIGAVPYRNEKIREVQSYMILEKKFI